MHVADIAQFYNNMLMSRVSPRFTTACLCHGVPQQMPRGASKTTHVQVLLHSACLPYAHFPGQYVSTSALLEIR